MNPILNPNVVEKIRNLNPNLYKDLNVKGYTFTRKTTDKKTEYMIIKKNSNKPAKKNYLLSSWRCIYWKIK